MLIEREQNCFPASTPSSEIVYCYWTQHSHQAGEEKRDIHFGPYHNKSIQKTFQNAQEEGNA